MKKGNNVVTKEVVEDEVDEKENAKENGAAIDEVEQQANKNEDVIEADSEEEEQFESDGDSNR